MTIIDQFTSGIALGLKNIAMKYYISMPSADFPLGAIATRHDFSQYKNLATEYTMSKLNPVAITPYHLANADIALGGDFRPVSFKLESVSAVMSLHPASISYSVALIDQSILSFDLISARVLGRYALDVEEIKCGDMLVSKGINYSCMHGTNGKTPTEATVRDLNKVTDSFRESGMVPILAQYIAGIAINTSGIPKAYALVGSPESITALTTGIDSINLGSFKSGFEYSGSSNYADNLRGVEQTSQISFISSNNFKNKIGDGAHSCIIVAADSFMMASSTPTSGALIGRDSLISSPTGLKMDYSIRCPIVQAITRPEGVRSFKFTEK